jgi:hypothetical protein
MKWRKNLWPLATRVFSSNVTNSGPADQTPAPIAGMVCAHKVPIRCLESCPMERAVRSAQVADVWANE